MAIRRRCASVCVRRSNGCRRAWRPYQRLSDFAITTEALPRTQIGKLRRHQLPERFERAQSGASDRETQPALSERDRELLESTLLGQVWAWLEERFAPKRLSPDTSPQLDLGLDFVRLDEPHPGARRALRGLLERGGRRPGDDAARSAGRDRAERGGRQGGAAEVRKLGPEPVRWLQPQGALIGLLGAVLFALNRILMRALFRVRAEGREHLPAEGSYLLAPNHASYLDPFAIGAALSWAALHRLYWAGWTGLLFRGPLTRLFSRIAHVLPVDPEGGLTSTLPLGKAALERGYALVWFPEGARSSDGRLHRFQPGAGWLLERTGVPAVPVWIGGSFDAWPPDRSWPRLRPIVVRFGRPISFESEGSEPNAERYRRIGDQLHDAVAALADDDGKAGAAAAARFDRLKPPPT